MWVRGIALFVMMNLGGAMPAPSFATPAVLDHLPSAWVPWSDAAQGGAWIVMVPVFALLGLFLRMSRAADPDDMLI